jgi:hypothetical protein
LPFYVCPHESDRPLFIDVDLRFNQSERWRRVFWGRSSREGEYPKNSINSTNPRNPLNALNHLNDLHLTDQTDETDEMDQTDQIDEIDQIDQPEPIKLSDYCQERRFDPGHWLFSLYRLEPPLTHQHW